MCFCESEIGSRLNEETKVLIKIIFHGAQLKGSTSKYVLPHCPSNSNAAGREQESCHSQRSCTRETEKYLTIYAVNFKEDIATVFNFISATHKECAKRQGTEDSEAPIMTPN